MSSLQKTNFHKSSSDRFYQNSRQKNQTLNLLVHKHKHTHTHTNAFTQLRTAESVKQLNTGLLYLSFSLAQSSQSLPGLTEHSVNVCAMHEDEKVREDIAAEVIQTVESRVHAVGALKMNKEQPLHV